ncbi:recombinase RecT [Candidatus Pacearchaeota archaeon]|nr:recombinase RecT [Candidatus Pacearchaeota archaeon]
MGEIQPWAQAIAKAENKFIEIAEKENNGMVFQKEAMFAMQLMKKNDFMQKMSPDSVFDAVVNVASIGLSLNPATKLAYLVPRDGRACLDISYLGLYQLAIDGGEIKHVKAELVYEGDTFTFNGVDEKPEHSYDPFMDYKDRGKLRGAYCLAMLTNGTYKVEFMPAIEIYKVKASAKTRKVWDAWFEEMAKKTVIKRAAKMWPKNNKVMHAIHHLNENGEGIDFNSVSTPTDNNYVDAVKLITEGDVEMLTSIIIDNKIDPMRIYKAFSIDSFTDLPEARLQECLDRIDEFLDAREKKVEASAVVETINNN